ncbi:universal stress protein [Natronorubrum daqingense]|uniref:Nucleotide-binding universal stress protein, UspA family n=1 Tax=Natronorubrum daqingense TaxID=588898 RepID=A0A1N7EUN9_9EURY|nr:universal stress protein [Natronorubrum daqingense]APX97712.1 universal stress protein UspA [Natronorubrum daqingense]SIR91655.1 Nucleotide-binding universal stress protein, UspA family [Natronorubrum daqingense]
MYHIVIPVDTSEERGAKATQYVIDLLDAGVISDAETISVTVLNVFEKFKAVDDGGNVSSAELYDEDDYPDAVVRARDLLEDAAIEYDLERRHGDSADEIVDFVEEADADLVVMAPRKRSSVGKAVFGSVAQNVLINTDRPTLIV